MHMRWDRSSLKRYITDYFSIVEDNSMSLLCAAVLHSASLDPKTAPVMTAPNNRRTKIPSGIMNLFLVYHDGSGFGKISASKYQEQRSNKWS